MDNLIDELTQKMMSEMNEKRESFIKEMLIKKGYKHLIPTEKMRFPKINRSISFDGWEYIFADNGTKQGDFIVAISPWKPNSVFDFSKLSEHNVSCQTTYDFTWQDKNYDAVFISQH